MPECCLNCVTGAFWGGSNARCNAEYIMTAKMCGKCPFFESEFDQRLVPTAYKNAMNKYKLKV